MSAVAWIAWVLAGLVILGAFVLGNVWWVMRDMDDQGEIRDDD